MSKGSGRRPQQVTDAEVQSNWERAFGKKPACKHEYVMDDEAAETVCCQKCGQVEKVK